MRVGDIFINGIGVELPERQSIESAVEQGLLRTDDATVQGFTSVAIAGDTPAPELALRAAQSAFKDCDVQPVEVALLVYANVWFQGPLTWQPQFYLQHHLVGDSPLAIEIKHGCVGMLSGMELAVGSLRADDKHQAALVVASDNFGTPLMDRWATGAGLTVLGDGASAVVLTKKPGFARLVSVCSGSFSGMEEAWRSGEPLFPPGVTVRRPVDFFGTHDAFRKSVTAEAAAIMSITHIQRNIECIQRTLAEADVRTGEIKKIITHTMSKEEQQSYVGMLGFSLEQSTWDFGRGIGHVGASDQVLALHHLLTTGQLVPGDRVLLCGFAPGSTYKAAVVEILDLPSWAPSR
ncbi:ketoacyl-ACP synthase III family protein [Micromonospora sp. NPDC047548]|uniref:ketoacyl-ACP synthase III family protein n=1 Tax=Micromonospora sp. NPDC047548 TaxID=3155624 RepID=UPI0033C32FE2